MLYTYTAIITESEGTFYAKVPDISGCITTAGSLSEAISLITDALNLSLVVLEDEDIEPPHPTPQPEIVHGDNDILTVIQADTFNIVVQPIQKLSEKMSLFLRGLQILLINPVSTALRFYKTLCYLFFHNSMGLSL